MTERKEVYNRQDIDLTVVGQGTMGTRILENCNIDGGQSRIIGLNRDSENYKEKLLRSKTILLCTKQDDGLEWLDKYGDHLTDQTVLSLMAFVNLSTLSRFCDNEGVKLARVMTDTSLENIVWTDDGNFSEQDKIRTRETLGIFSGKVEYLGSNNDESILQETIKACCLGWIAADLHSNVDALLGSGLESEDATALVDEILQKIMVQRSAGLTFRQIFTQVATEGGVTKTSQMSCSDRIDSVFEDRLEFGYEFAKKLESKYDRLATKKGLAARTN